MARGVVRFEARKRVFGVESTTVTRSKRINAQLHPSLIRSDIHVPPPSQPNMSKSTEGVANSEYPRQAPIEG